MNGTHILRGAAAALLCLISVFRGEAREVYNLNREWTFGRSITDSRNCTTVNLPHTWQKAGPENRIGNSAQYLKEIFVPASWEQKKVYIRFKGVATSANLFINGKFVGEHYGAYTAFTFDITPFLMFNVRNAIVLNVDGSTQMNLMPINGNFNTYGGIYRDVELIVTDRTHIAVNHFSSDGVYVHQDSLTPEKAVVDVIVRLEGTYGDKVRVESTILKEGDPVASLGKELEIPIDGEGEATFTFELPEPRMWNGKKDPFLYQVRTVMYDAHDKPSDEVTVGFGLRSVSIERDRGFFLNGQSYPLYGVTRMQEHPDVATAMTKMNHREDMELIEELGATAIRMIYAPQDPYVYDLCDEKGIVVWSDLPFVGDRIYKGKGFVNSFLFKENGRKQFQEMIYQLYNHPSIAFWGLFTNITAKGDSPLEYIRELNEMAHFLTPNIITTATSNEDGPINFITDAIAWGQYFGWRSGKPEDIKLWLDPFASKWRELKPALGEYGAGANIYQQSEQTKPASEESDWHPEGWQTRFHETYLNNIKGRPYLWGYFVNTLFDYGQSSYHNGLESGVNDLGLVTGDRHVKKDAFYLYKANWNPDDPFVHITGRRNDLLTAPVQQITVYSNQPEAELWVNGESAGRKATSGGIVRWDNVKLQKGENLIRVTGSGTADEVILFVSDALVVR